MIKAEFCVCLIFILFLPRFSFELVPHVLPSAVQFNLHFVCGTSHTHARYDCLCNIDHLCTAFRIHEYLYSIIWYFEISFYLCVLSILITYSVHNLFLFLSPSKTTFNLRLSVYLSMLNLISHSCIYVSILAAYMSLSFPVFNLCVSAFYSLHSTFLFLILSTWIFPIFSLHMSMYPHHQIQST
jgi:hypothetical protein